MRDAASLSPTDKEASTSSGLVDVLLTIEDYQRLAGGNMSLAEALAQPGVAADFAFEPPRVGGWIFKPADLD